jgi:TPR repeat protein
MSRRTSPSASSCSPRLPRATAFEARRGGTLAEPPRPPARGRIAGRRRTARGQCRRARTRPAYGAYQRGEYLAAFELALPLAEAGNAKSQTLLGMLYAEGFGVPQNLVEAAGWYEIAANGGDADAQLAVGLAYLEGVGVAVDRERGARFLEMAAAQDNGEALYNLGLLILAGEVRPFDMPQVVDHFTAPPSSASPSATVCRGSALHAGRSRHPPTRRSPTAGSARAEGASSRRRSNMASHRQRDRRRDERGRGGLLRLQRAFAGNPVGQVRYGRMLAVGVGVAPNPVEAGRWYLLARAAGLDDEWLADFFAGLNEADRNAAIAAAGDLGVFR